jgi:hypothetical protein
MKSHTVPKRLLKQFAYNDLSTKSPRLWEYRKGKKPNGLASPKTATRIDGFFANPEDAQFEAIVEARLNAEIEEPVNRFLSDISDPTFAATDAQRRSLTRYIFLLFNRSAARKKATEPLMDIKIHALESFLKNDAQLATVAAQWNIQAYYDGRRFERLITTEDVARSARRVNSFSKSPMELQKTFAEGIVNQMTHLDDKLYGGEWKVIRAQPNDPFMLSDAPVITFVRSQSGVVSYGVGFHEPNVEVALPISPTVCLHVLPDVRRTLPTIPPTTYEINRGQAGFASQSCYANENLPQLDKHMQEFGCSLEMGKNVFTLPRSNYNNIFYDILMGVRKGG